MSGLIGALGAVIGYIGAEAAEAAIFDRLLWPQRFFHRPTASDTVKLAFFLSMAGPLHGAALAALDRFRKHELYLGRQRGDMLRMAFFDKMDVSYSCRSARTAAERAEPKEVRNGFWINVLRFANRMACVEARAKSSSSSPTPLHDVEHGPRNDITPSTDKTGTHTSAALVAKDIRAYRAFFTLDLEFWPNDSNKGKKLENDVYISELQPSLWTVLGVFASELSTLAVVLAAALWASLLDGDVPPRWFIGYLCIPLFLKLLAVPLTVRRAGIKAPKHEANAADSLPSDFKEIFEISCPSIGFSLIRTLAGQGDVARQIFRHYGHPLREKRSDRVREVMCMGLVYAYVLYFPVGLLLLAWLNESTQYLWLGHQLYCVMAMHIVRVCGWQETSRTEEHVAAVLVKGNAVVLVGDGCSVRATLIYEHVCSVTEGKRKLAKLLGENNALRPMDEN